MWKNPGRSWRPPENQNRISFLSLGRMKASPLNEAMINPDPVMKNERQIFLACARQLHEADPNHPLGLRYLSVVRRRRVIKWGIRRAQRMSALRSPLSATGFKPPLSVAGCGSAAIV